MIQCLLWLLLAVLLGGLECIVVDITVVMNTPSYSDEMMMSRLLYKCYWLVVLLCDLQYIVDTMLVMNAGPCCSAAGVEMN